MNRGVASVLAVCMAGMLVPANPGAGQVGRYAGIVPNGGVAIRPLSIIAFSIGLHRSAIRQQYGWKLAVGEKAAANQCRCAVPGNRGSAR